MQNGCNLKNIFETDGPYFMNFRSNYKKSHEVEGVKYKIDLTRKSRSKYI
jgi:hypothetical protein